MLTPANIDLKSSGGIIIVYSKRVILLFLVVLFFSIETNAQNKQLTIDDIYDPQKQVNFNGTLPRITKWLDDKHYLQFNNNPSLGPVGLLKVDAQSAKAESFIDKEKMEKALATTPGFSHDSAAKFINLSGYIFSPNNDGVLIEYENDLYYYVFGADKALRLTTNPEEETNPSFSPDGKLVAFVRNNNLYTIDLSSTKETALTTDGSKTIFNGRLDWVYEEEIYGRGTTQAYWWSPNSSDITYLTLDESKVPAFTVIDHLPLYQTLEVTNYPKVGEPNPTVKLSVVSAKGGSPRPVELANYQSMEFLITRVGWTPDSKNVVYQVQNRAQTWLDLNLADSQTGKTRNLLRETSPAWVEVVELPEWLADGSFLWQSDRTGWRHIYHYSLEGKLISAVTKGNWDVRELYGAKDGWVYFTGSQHGRISNDVYKIKADGTSLTHLTANWQGNHNPRFNPDFTAFIDVASNINTPPQMHLYKNDGSLLRTIEENKVAALANFNLGKPEFIRVPTRDGAMMDALMIKPPDFDPNKKYPVMSYNYSGPATPSVRNSWLGTTYIWHQMLAQKGYIIWICDNRSASQQGIASTYPIYRNMAELELKDLEDGVSWLKQQSYVDGSRIGIWGWSYGGYMTAYALTHSKNFKIGISGAPVTDWRNYDSVYTERYMGLLKDNPEGYKKSSVVEAAANLHGKLLLIHGTMDDNVHMQNSVQFIDALQKAGKQFDLMIYPKSRHGVVQPQRLKHLREMMTNFILENL
ncbi:MAG: S9 family peptidase [Acidobacteria bacterium]|nr:S9 family peptidase [Acidobacteriota bacterium]